MADVFSHRFSTKYFDPETGLYYYGYRFYAPDLGRWINRDPIGEEGGLNMYVCCNNKLVCHVDRFGLSWRIKRDSTQSWTEATPESINDTFMGLAKQIHFDYQEIEKWSNGTAKQGSVVTVGCKYLVPNIYVFYTSNRKPFDWILVVDKWQDKVRAMSDEYKTEGFKTIEYFNHDRKAHFRNAWTLDGIAGVFYAGHGDDGGLTMNALSEDFIFPNQVHPNYKLSIGIFDACESKMMYNSQRWQDHFAVDYGAVFRGFSGKAYLWTPLEGPVVQPSLWETLDAP